MKLGHLLESEHFSVNILQLIESKDILQTFRRQEETYKDTDTCVLAPYRELKLTFLKKLISLSPLFPEIHWERHQTRHVFLFSFDTIFIPYNFFQLPVKIQEIPLILARILKNVMSLETIFIQVVAELLPLHGFHIECFQYN